MSPLLEGVKQTLTSRRILNFTPSWFSVKSVLVVLSSFPSLT